MRGLEPRNPKSKAFAELTMHVVRSLDSRGILGRVIVVKAVTSDERFSLNVQVQRWNDVTMIQDEIGFEDFSFGSRAWWNL